MYNENNWKNYFENSEIYSEIKTSLNVSQSINSEEYNLSILAIKLWLESVIKHNICAQSIDVDMFTLVTTENSDTIQKNLGIILWKNPDKRTEQEYTVLRKIRKHFDRINKIYTYQKIKNKVDIYKIIKEEFVTKITA